ncbi:hypothetical protein ACVBEF_02830 [Glaciimonas sp. GG7]
MNQQDVSMAKDKDLAASMAAMKRAAASARQLAIEKGTAIIVVQDGKIVRLTADDLKKERGER